MYVYVAVALIAAFLSGAGTWRVQDWRYAAKDKERIEAALESRRMAEKQGDGAAVGHEGDKVRIRKVFVPINQEVERVVEKPVYREFCFDDSGLRLISTALLSTPTTSQPAGTVSRSVTAR